MTTNPPQPDWPTQPSPWPGPYPPKPPTVTPLTRSLVPPLPTQYTAGHRLVHPHPQAGCPWCPQEGLSCRWCGLPLDACRDVAGHGRLHAGAESTWGWAA